MLSVLYAIEVNQARLSEEKLTLIKQYWSTWLRLACGFWMESPFKFLLILIGGKYVTGKKNKHGHRANETSVPLNRCYSLVVFFLCVCFFFFSFQNIYILLVGCNSTAKHRPAWNSVPGGLRRESWSSSNVETPFCANGVSSFRITKSVFHSRRERCLLFKADGLTVQERRMKRDHGRKGSWRCRD